jgi:hypothetical protein
MWAVRQQRLFKHCIRIVADFLGAIRIHVRNIYSQFKIFRIAVMYFYFACPLLYIVKVTNI